MKAHYNVRREAQFEALDEAREIAALLKTAYREHIAGRGLTRRYKIKDREMEFSSPAEILQQLRYWQRETARLEAATGLVPRARRIISRF